MKRLAAAFLVLCSTCLASDNLELLIGPEEIAQKVSEVATQINKEYQDENLTIIMVMKGAVCVSADLIRELNIPFTLEYMKASSYGLRGATPEQVKITGIDNLDVTGKNLLVVDDIFDSGNTMTAIVSHLEKRNPKSLKTLVLLVKNVDRQTDYSPDYTMFNIENRFVVGYGLDYKEHYRGLPGVYAFVNDTPPN